jgi:hypothetical protein
MMSMKSEMAFKPGNHRMDFVDFEGENGSTAPYGESLALSIRKFRTLLNSLYI